MPKIVSTENYMRRIYLHDEEKLFAAVETKIRLLSEQNPDELGEKTQYERNWEKFLADYQPKTRNGKVHLQYDRIDEFLNVTGFSYLELLEICCGEDNQRAEINWPKKIEKSMANLVDSMPREMAAFWTNSIEAMIPESVLTPLKDEHKSINRCFAIADAHATDISYVWSRLDDKSKYLRQAYYFRNDPDKPVPDNLPYFLVKRLSEAFDLSPHFLLGLNDKETCLCRKGSTEVLMDAFCTLPDAWKNRVYAGAKGMMTEYRKERRG